MKDSTQISEFKQVHARIDELVEAQNLMTEHVSGAMLRNRAYDNLINRSWVLSRFLSNKRMFKEMTMINEAEVTIRTEEERIKNRNQREADLARKQAADAAEKQAEIDHREKKLNRQIRKEKQK